MGKEEGLMQKTELLAPAKNLECLKKVIECGADSIYMGYSRFNARMFGKNFSVQEFKEGVAYAHERNVKVYLTLNTLIKEYELDDAIQFARRAVNDGVDGILVQDLGVALAIRKKIPQAVLQASTQMSIANHYGVKILKVLGFSRVVLARELNSKEITKIKQIVTHKYNNDMEIEAFVHGGLCISYSGQCFASSYHYNSSANRGMCRMPCWEKYIFIENNDILDSGTVIRPKDLNGIFELKRLIEGGIDCLKIQGRLRDDKYISEITNIYRNCIDSYRDFSIDKEFFENYKKRLLAISPRGLTEGNICEKVSKDIIIKDTAHSEKIEDVSCKSCEDEEVLNEEEIKDSGVSSNKRISVFLHRLNKSCSYSELTQEISKIYIPFREFTRNDIKDVLTNICYRFDTFLYMPPMVYERNCEQYYALVEEILNQFCLKGIVLSNLSDFVLKEQLKNKAIEFISGNNLHVMNSLAAEALKVMGVVNSTLSLELSPKDAISVVLNSSIPLEQIVYGHPELMHLKYCLYRKQNECGDCDICKENESERKYFLQGKENTFEVLFYPEQTESILYSMKILSVPANEWVGNSVRMDFLWETPYEINEIVSLMKNGYYHSGSKYLRMINID